VGFALLNPPYALRAIRSGMANGRRAAAGGPRSAVDMINAAIAAANNCTVITADYRDFRGAVNCFNPLTSRG
jgi:predicted nucleic acid-binding protein